MSWVDNPEEGVKPGRELQLARARAGRDGTATVARDPEHATFVRDHTVVLYDDERQHVRAIGERASGVLASGGSVVLLGTREQRKAVEEWIDLTCDAAAPLRAPGRYTSIDADAVAEELAIAEEPAQVFEEVISRARTKIDAASTMVYVFGSLVGALWERDRRDLVASIETVANRLADERGTSIVCAYRAAAVGVEAGRVVDSCHSAVVRSPALRLFPLHAGRTDARRADPDVTRIKVFPPEAPACRAARHFVRAILESSESNEDVVDAIELICSELSANAVRHAHSAFTVALEHAPTYVRIAVADEMPPAPDDADTFPVDIGRGLGIVATLARDWGVEHDETGHAVWAEVTEDGAGPPTPPDGAARDLPGSPGAAGPAADA